uniref:LigA n=1 Tax=Parastrongyloides trichosuri TaxID=131310 RepID=A0A0N5A0Z0_PARTI
MSIVRLNEGAGPGGDRADRSRLRQGLGHETGQGWRGGRDRKRLDRLAGPRHGARHRRPAGRPGDRGVRPRILGQDDARPAHRGRGPEEGRRGRLRRRRTRAGPGLCAKAGRQPGRPAGVAARHGRAGAGDRRHPGALGRRGHRGGRLGRRPDATRGNRRRDGRQPARPAGPPDVAGPAQTDGLDLQVEVHRPVHQPDPSQDRRHVRLARDDDGRQCAEVLRLGAPRHPPHRRDQEPRRGRRQHHPRQGGQEQGRSAVPRGHLRHHVRRRHLQDRRDHRSGRQGQHHREVRFVVLLRLHPHRSGPREREGVPEEQPRHGPRHREGGAPVDGQDRRRHAGRARAGRRSGSGGLIRPIT